MAQTSHNLTPSGAPVTILAEEPINSHIFVSFYIFPFLFYYKTFITTINVDTPNILSFVVVLSLILSMYLMVMFSVNTYYTHLSYYYTTSISTVIIEIIGRVLIL